MQRNSHEESQPIEALKPIAAELINYLNETQRRTKKNIDELFEKDNNRVFFSQGGTELYDEVTDKDNNKVKIGLDQKIRGLLMNPEILKAFVQKYKNWQLDFFPVDKNFDGKLKEFKEKFVDYFFAPIANTDTWKNFVNQANLTPNQQDMIAGALLTRIHSVAIGAKEELSTKMGLSPDELDKVTLSVDQISQKGKTSLFGLFMGHKWNSESEKILRDGVQGIQERVLNFEFDGLLPKLRSDLDFADFEKGIITAVSNVRKNPLFKDYFKNEVQNEAQKKKAENDFRAIIKDKLKDLEGQIGLDLKGKGKSKGFSDKQKAEANTHLQNAWREALKHENPIMQQGMFRSTSLSHERRLVTKEEKERDKVTTTKTPGKTG